MPPDIRRIPFRKYAELALRVKKREGGMMVPLRLKPVQQRIDDVIDGFHARGRTARVVVDKSRRLGTSTYVAGRFSHRVFTAAYQRGVVIAHRGPDAKQIFGIYERMYDHLPGVIKPTRSGGKGQLLAFPTMYSQIEVGSAETVNFGRGSDAQLVHISEAAYAKDMAALMSAIMPGVASVGDGIVVLESTANGPGTWWHQMWRDSEDGVSGFVPLFFAWFEDPDHRLPEAIPDEDWTEEEQSWHEQWGVDGFQIAWLRDRQEVDCRGRDDVRRREYPCTSSESFTNVGESAWEPEEVLAVYERREPVFRGMIGDNGLYPDPDGHLVIWEFPQDRAEYVIGADPAGGLREREGDLSVASVFRAGRKPGQWPVQVAEWAGHQDPITFAKTLTLLGHFYRRALLACEVTGLGIGTESALQRTYYYPRLHRWIRPDQYKSKSDTWGWQTTPNSKDQMMGIADWLIRTKHVTLRSPEAVDEFMAYQEVSPGVYEGMKGDDRVMGAMIAWVSWAQHSFAGIPLKEIRQMLARLYGGAGGGEAKVARRDPKEIEREVAEQLGLKSLRGDEEEGDTEEEVDDAERAWQAQMRARRRERTVTTDF